MQIVVFLLGFVIYMTYRAVKNRSVPTKKESEISDFEDNFKEIYGTTWDSWVTVKRDLLADDDAFISSIKAVFNDMYRTVQERGQIRKVGK